MALLSSAVYQQQHPAEKPRSQPQNPSRIILAGIPTTCFLSYLYSDQIRQVNKKKEVLMHEIIRQHGGSSVCHCESWFVLFSDLCRTSVCVPGDYLSVAVVHWLSRKDLDKMDELCEGDTEDTVGLTQ
ncbi:hypothetical protein ATANTOWER_002331 [Ataeniobius toweri]|uniref:Uncharacterized protein n=1 Tax=Ataeniobius toweri TaxID=208326 RepID=A0ABU7BM50_9TELE|nr:hypothetical protein [Ataeniobius toweri]